MFHFKYWVRAELTVSVPNQPPQRVGISIGMERERPVSDFDHVMELAQACANKFAADQGIPPQMVSAAVIGFQRLEPAIIVAHA